MRFAALMQARSACCGLRYRFGASHRANARPPHASRKLTIN
ncbi:MAG: hypothetical protein RML94_04330 [Bacteroidia bacterium]|nr:hypothetical protein [Bacteroidia bacterium]